MGCERCRLWGKLQFLGLGTAMKILFADDASSIGTLSRNEVVALLNVLHRLSMSLSAIEIMRDLEAQRTLHATFVRGVGSVVALLAALLALRGYVAPTARKTKTQAGGPGPAAAAAAAAAAVAAAGGDEAGAGTGVSDSKRDGGGASSVGDGAGADGPVHDDAGAEEAAPASAASSSARSKGARRRRD